MANDSTNAGVSSSVEETTTHNENYFTDMQAEDAFFGPEQLAQAAAEKVVPVPPGENVIRVQVNPGEIIELSSPFDAGATLLAREGDGNLAIRVGDVTVILQGYVDANQQAPVVIHSSDGQPIDIATLLASTDPTIDIQTAAGPGDAAGQGGQGADNTGAILSQLANGNGLGGLNAVGAQDGTSLNYGLIDNSIRLDRDDALLASTLSPGFKGLSEPFLRDPFNNDAFSDFASFFTHYQSDVDGTGNAWADFTGTAANGTDFESYLEQTSFTNLVSHSSTISEPISIDIGALEVALAGQTSNQHALYVDMSTVAWDGTATTVFVRREGDDALILVIHAHAAGEGLDGDSSYSTGDFQIDTYLINRLDHPDQGQDIINLDVPFKVRDFNGEEQEPTFTEGSVGVPILDDIPVVHEADYYSFLHSTSCKDALDCFSTFFGGKITDYVITNDAGHVDEDYIFGGNRDKDNANGPDSDSDRGDNIGDKFVVGMLNIDFGADGPAGKVPAGTDCHDQSDAGDTETPALAIGGLKCGDPYPDATSQGHDLIVLKHEKLPFPFSSVEMVQVGYKLDDEKPTSGDALTSSTGGCEVVVFTLLLQTDPNQPLFGGFVFQQCEPLDHEVGATLETDLPLNFQVIATDDDGDHPVDPVTINIMVNDDAPYFSITYTNEDPRNCDTREIEALSSSSDHVDHYTTKDFGHVDEDWLNGGSTGVLTAVTFANYPGNRDQDAFYKDNANLFGDDRGGLDVCGQIKVKYGADGPSDAEDNGNLALTTYDTSDGKHPEFINGDGGTLTSGGLTLVVLYSDPGKLVVGTAVEVDGGERGTYIEEHPVFCLELDPCTGKFEFHLLAAIDHDPATVGGNPESNLVLSFDVGSAEDFDRDKALGAINIKVNDDHPEASITYCNEIPSTTCDGDVVIGHTTDTDFGRVDEDWLRDGTSISNGSFEDPTTVNLLSFDELDGPGGLDDWTIGGAGVDHIHGYWNPSDGSQSLDLSQHDAGSISRELTGLTPGREYTITFDMAGNPDGGPTIKTLKIEVGSVSSNYSFDTTGHSLANMGWEGKSFTFVATGETETLTFTSLDNTPFGPALDNVKITAHNVGNQDLDANGNSNANQYGDDYGSTHVSGQINMKYGADGPGTQSLGLALLTEGSAAKDADGNAMSSQGHALTVLTSTDSRIEIGYDGFVVFCLTLNTTSGHFDFSQHLPIDHPIASPIEDNVYLAFNAGSISDKDGDTSEAVIKIQVNDDVPETAVTYHNDDTGPEPTFTLTALPASYGKVDEDFLHHGNKDADNSTPGSPTDYARGDEAGGTCVTGCIGGDTKYGADGPDGTPTHSFVLTELKADDAFVDADGNQLKSHDNLLVVLSSDGETLEVGYHDPEGGDDTVVFTLTMTSENEFKFELEAPLDDPQGKCDPIEQGIVLAFGAEDGGAPTDKDQDPAVRIVIHVNDDAPKLCEISYCPGGKSGLVDEDYLHGGNHDKDNNPSAPSDWDRGDTIGGHKLTGQVVVDFGADGKGEQAFSFDSYKAGDCFTDACGNTFSSHGHELNVLEATADHLIVGYSDWQGNSTTVFELSIDDCGNFCIDLEKPLDHPVDCKPEDGLKMVFDVTATDFDGDSVDARINIKVNDDAPAACGVSYHNQDTGDYEENTLTSTSGGGDHDKIGKVDEDWLENGNQDQDNCPPGAPKDWKQGDSNGGTCVTGCLNIKFGADGPAGDCGQQALGLKAVPDVGCAYPNMSNPLTSGGHTLVVLEHCTDSKGIETLVVGYKDEGHGDSAPFTTTSYGGGGSGCETVIFTLTLHTDPKDCDFQEFKFDLNGPLDHAVDGKPETNLLLCFAVEATDYDGDTACTDIKIQVNDDAPMALDPHYHNQHTGESEPVLTAFSGGDSCDTIGKVDEDWLPNGNQDKDIVADKVANGSFEDPVVIGNFDTLAGPDGITGWTVTGSGVDLIHDYWNASEGDQSVDVNATGPGTLSTLLTGLVVGQHYTISFDLAGNPEIEQGVKQLQVTVAGYDNTFEVDTTGKSLSDPLEWTTQSFTFVAQHESETLTFASLSSGPCGPVLDNVAIVWSGSIDGDQDGGTCVTGCLNISYGGDGPADNHLAKVENGSPALHLKDVPEVGCAYPNMSCPLTSGGKPLVVLEHCTDSDGVEKLVVGYQVASLVASDGVPVFTLTLHTDPCDPCFQDFKFELQGTLDQDLSQTIENDLLLTFGVIATDNDGDPVCTEIKISVNDDSPHAVNDIQSFYYWREDLSGNVLANDKKGADGATVTHLVTATGAVDVIGTSAAEIAGLHGTFFVYADGTYTYAPDNYNNNHEPGDDSLTYTVTDGDGDTSTATLTITYTPATHTPTPGEYDKNISTDDDYNAEVDNPAAYQAGKTFHIVDNGDGHEIRGGKGDDWIVAHGGGDNLFGRGGNDILEGNAGKDKLHGGNGDDTLFGGNNDDDLTGGAGHDAMSGGGGGDVFHDVDAQDLDGVNLLDGQHSIDGGTGEDTVELGGLTAFGLAEAARVENVEHLDLKANSNGDNAGTTVTLDHGAVYGITEVGGLHVLTISGDAAGAGADNVVLQNDGTHAWAFDSNFGGFNIYTAGSGAEQVTVKVQEDVAVAV